MRFLCDTSNFSRGPLDEAFRALLRRYRLMQRSTLSGHEEHKASGWVTFSMISLILL